MVKQVIGDLKLVWRNRRYRLLFVARFVSNIGNGLMPIALAFGVLSLRGGSATELSYVTTSQMLPIVLFLLIGGVVADRFGRAQLVGGTDIIGSFAVGAMGLLFITHHATVLLLCVAGAISGILNAIWYPAFVGLMPEIVEPEELQPANSLLGFGANIGYIIGASTAGIIVNTAGAGWAILTNAATFLVAGVVVWQLRTPRPALAKDVHNESIIQQMKEGWREFKSREWLVVIVAAFALSNMCFEGYLGVLAPLRMKEAFDGPSSMSWLLTAFSLGSVAGVLLSIRVNPRRPLVAAMSLFPLLGVLMLGTGIAVPLIALMPLAFLGGIALDMFWVLWITTMQREIPEELRGRIGAYDAFGSTVFAPLGLFVAGPLAAWISSRTTLLIAGTVVIVASSATLLSKGVRSVSAEPAQTTTDSN